MRLFCPYSNPSNFQYSTKKYKIIDEFIFAEEKKVWITIRIYPLDLQARPMNTWFRDHS